jgi:SAM-dependent methyltransferase
VDPKRVVADGYDRLGPAFSAWNEARPPDVRSWFLGEVLARLGEGSDVLELGCGPGTAAAALSTTPGGSQPEPSGLPCADEAPPLS